MRNLAKNLGALFRQPSPSNVSTHYHWLDLVRGVAAIAVLIWHYQHFYYPKAGHYPFFGEGYGFDRQPFFDALQLFYVSGLRAVQLFWVISGFVFAASYSHARSSGREFFVNRFARLYPLHFATLLTVALLQGISLCMFNDFQIFARNDLYHFVLNLLFISHWGFEKGPSFNFPIWSVSLELFIYLVFWLVVRWIFRIGVLGPAILGGFFFVLLVRHVPGVFWECGALFFLGCAVWVWFISFQQRPAVNVCVGIAAVIAGVRLLRDAPLFVFSGTQKMGLIILFCGLVLIAAAIDSLDKARYGKKVAWLGDISYGVYLLHTPVQIAVILVIDALLLDRVQVVSNPWFFIAFVAFVIALAWLCYRWFELPSRQWIRRRLGSSSSSKHVAEA